MSLFKIIPARASTPEEQAACDHVAALVEEMYKKHAQAIDEEILRRATDCLITGQPFDTDFKEFMESLDL